MWAGTELSTPQGAKAGTDLAGQPQRIPGWRAAAEFCSDSVAPAALGKMDGDWSSRKLVSCSYCRECDRLQILGLLQAAPSAQRPRTLASALDSLGWGDGVHVLPASAGHFNIVSGRSDLDFVIREAPGA